ncbi:Mucin-associated surface protein (MASP) [Trypanosoma cruzi]|uniref:Mucin-associated surface protein (MASP), putative n=2 Tax=Trypanosoma cruzi TaxID=5693 RepID=Q4E5T1_TRYCC|nr:mucin-associated surface protein (MASP), putative [Trypanosoma cruzi]EAO00180.1 mucin-associated surface protein (MASP), putative [Trypanosoma cruzi]PWV21258.1 Mucin-associated surface protein (MASP) [Trypanosoma cruzi]RNC43639.1 mucin-associated surface protein (MASP) [Trypanosoma cruzi]|eukprot:XP_822031.1 mucin-associated surface protein (MASP) [Trypanosoma cruzi strain CL Brener]
MAMMMTGRVLLVCALCVLWCGATVVGSVANDVVDGGIKEGPLGGSQSDFRDEKAGKPELSESVDEGLGSAGHSLDTRSGTNVSEQGNLVNEPPTGNVGKEEVEGEALGTQRNEVHEQQVEEEGKELTVKQKSQTKDKGTLPQSTPPTTAGRITSPPPTPALMQGSPRTPGQPKENSQKSTGQPPKLQVPPAKSPSQASDLGEADAGPVGIKGTGRNVIGGSLDKNKDPKGREGHISGPPSGGASLSPISNNGDASQMNGGAPSTQDTKSLKNNEQSGPTTYSGNAPLNRETPETSTPDAKQHSSETQENETSRVADGDANYTAAGQSAVGTKGSSGVSTTASNAPTTLQPQLPASPVPPTATVTGAPAEKPTAERSPPPADSTTGGNLAATTTAPTNDTTTKPGDSDSNTAVSHTTSPLLLLLVVVACAAAVVAA